MKKTNWFPFALAATSVVMLLAGARSKWTLDKDKEPPPPPPPDPGVKGAYWP